MIRNIQRTSSRRAFLAMAAGAGALLASAQVGAATGFRSHGIMAAPAPQRIAPDELQRLLDQIVAAGAPGAVARVEDENGIQRATSGVADLQTGRPMRPELHFRAGSNTKSFVATLVLKLIADGVLSLSDTVERWLPGILPYGDQVTIRQLLSHTGGVPQNVQLVYRPLYASEQARFRAWTPRELVALVADRPLDFPPGTSWSYSNTGYNLMDMIVEAATGNPLDQELAQRIFEPLGLRDTIYPVHDPDLPRPEARGYSLPLSPELEVLDGPLVDFTALDPSWAGAAGGLVSNLDDLARFFGALLSGELLPAGLLAEMLPSVTVPPEAIPLPLYDRYGLGLQETATPAGHLVGHAGGIPGFLSIVLSTRDGSRQLGVMINLGDLAPDPVYEAFFQAYQAIGARLLS